MRVDRCPACGGFDVVLRGAEARCRGCGGKFTEADVAPCPRCAEPMRVGELGCPSCAPAQARAAGAAGNGAELVGMGGWLLFLAVVLVGIRPVMTALGLLRTVQAWDRVVGIGLQPWMATLATVDVATALVGIAAGVALLRLHPRAIDLCRAVIIATAIAPFGAVLLAPLWMDGALAREAMSSFIAPALRSVLFAVLWLAYLQRSKRVRNTFPPRAAASAPPTGAGTAEGAP